MTSALYKQISAKMAHALKNEDGSGFAQADRMYSATLATDNQMTVAAFIEYEGVYALYRQGYVLAGSDFLEENDDVSPCEFDSIEEYRAAIKADKDKRESLKVVNPEDLLVETVNYKGEGEKFILKADAARLHKFISKADSFKRF